MFPSEFRLAGSAASLGGSVRGVLRVREPRRAMFPSGFRLAGSAASLGGLVPGVHKGREPRG